MSQEQRYYRLYNSLPKGQRQEQELRSWLEQEQQVDDEDTISLTESYSEDEDEADVDVIELQDFDEDEYMTYEESAREILKIQTNLPDFFVNDTKFLGIQDNRAWFRSFLQVRGQYMPSDQRFVVIYILTDDEEAENPRPFFCVYVDGHAAGNDTLRGITQILKDYSVKVNNIRYSSTFPLLTDLIKYINQKAILPTPS